MTTVKGFSRRRLRRRVFYPYDPPYLKFKQYDVREKGLFTFREAHILYISYLNGFLPIESFLEYVRPYVKAKAYKHFGDLCGGEACEDLIQAAIIRLWKVAENGIIPSSPIALFVSHIVRGIYWSFCLEYKVNKDPVLCATFDLSLYRGFFKRTFISTEDVEDGIFLDELPEVIKSQIISHIRFENPAFRNCVEYILNQILNGEKIAVDQVKRRVKVEDVDYRFFLEHVFILIRNSLYDIKSKINFYRKPDYFREIIESFYNTYWEEDE